LANPCASEDELSEALVEKVGYILGGMERVTAKVIERCDKLRAIAFTGSDYRGFIPGTEQALARGITISDCPGANSDSVAELAIAGFLTLSRGLFEIGRLGDKAFLTTKSIPDFKFVIVGMGPLGQSIAQKLRALGAKSIAYENRTRYPEHEQRLEMSFQSLEDLFSECNAIFLATASARGAGYINGSHLERLQPGSIISDCSFEGAMEPKACLSALQNKRCKIFQDSKLADPMFDAIPPSDLYWTNNTGYNTESALSRVSDIVTESIINMLKAGGDQYRVV